jgi:hypothetical protein
VRDLHEVNAWVLIVLNAVVGAWFLCAHRWEQVRGRALWSAAVVAQVSVFTQAVFGAVLASDDAVVLDDMHMLYGVSAIVAVGIMYSYRGSPFMKGSEHLLYGFGSWFVMGLGIRNLVL